MQSVGLLNSSDDVNLLHKNMHALKTTTEIISHEEEAGLKESLNDTKCLFMPQNRKNLYYKTWQISDFGNDSNKSSSCSLSQIYRVGKL
jgi:hypothetical protein